MEDEEDKEELMNKEELMTLLAQGTLHCSCLEHCFLLVLQSFQVGDPECRKEGTAHFVVQTDVGGMVGCAFHDHPALPCIQASFTLHFHTGPSFAETPHIGVDKEHPKRVLNSKRAAPDFFLSPIH